MPVINATESLILDTYGACYYGSALSIIAGLCIVYTYATVPALRVQPNSILCAKAVFDSLLAVMIAIEYVPFVNVTLESDPLQWRDCGGDFYFPDGTTGRSSHGWVATFLTQWFFTLSLLCFGIVALDLMINSTNPFANMRKNNFRYATGIFFVSLIPPTVMVADIGGKVGSGRWILGFCFTKWTETYAGSNHSQSDGSLYNWRIWALNIAVIIVMLLFSLVMSLFFCRQNQLKAKARGKLFGEEDKFMSEVLQTTLNCVVAFLVYWLLNAALYAALFVIVELEDHDINIGENAKALASVFGFIFSAQGMVLLPFWFRGSCCAKEGVSSSNVLIIKEQLGNSFSCRCSRNFQKKGSKYEVAPTTNSALRKEIVTYLSNGIQLLKDVKSRHAEIRPTYAKLRLLITDEVDDSEWVAPKSPSSRSPSARSQTSPLQKEVTLVSKSAVDNDDEKLSETAADLDDIPQHNDIERPVSVRQVSTRNKDHVHIVPLNSQGGCVVTEMWPQQMAAVRAAMFDDPDVYHQSLSSISAAKLSGGKSEAFMFKTDDKRFVLKTMTGGEFRQLKRMMMVPERSHRHRSASEQDDTTIDDDESSSASAHLNPRRRMSSTTADSNNKMAFWQYMISQPESFIVKIFGVYKMTLFRYGSLSEGVTQYFIVMQNVFYDSDTSAQMDLIQETYDLKGSTVGRSADPLKPGTHAICRYCRREFVVGEKNVATPQPGDFVQLLSDYELTNSNGAGIPSPHEDGYGIRTGILQRQFQDGKWRIKWPQAWPGLPRDQLSPGGEDMTFSVHSPEELCWSDGTRMQIPKDASQKCKVNRRHEPVQVFKDNDLKYKIVVSPTKKFEIGRQLRMDSAFLARHRVMDYSLLLGVHRSQFLRTRASKWPVPVVRMTKTHGDIAYGYEGTSVSEHSVRAPRDSVASIMSSQPSQGSRAARLSGDGDDLTAHIGLLHGRARAQLMEGPTKFYFGIIDILQRWNSSKRSERIAKKLFCCVVGQALSSTEPRAYKHRFDRFMNEQVFDTANSKANVILQSDCKTRSWVLEIPQEIVHSPAADCIEDVQSFAVSHAARSCHVAPEHIQLDHQNVADCCSSLTTGQFLHEIPIMTFSYPGSPGWSAQTPPQTTTGPETTV